MTVVDSSDLAAHHGLPDHSGTGLLWTRACTLDSMIANRGVAVLLRGGDQAALFMLDDRSLVAVGNIDPYGRAAVLSRGIVGDRRGEPTVASPLLKHVFSLRDGRCLDDPGTRIPVYAVDVADGVISVGAPAG